MSEKIIIDIVKEKNLEDFSKALADSSSRVDAGCASAACASMAAGLLCRAAGLIKNINPDNERIDYIHKNSEILRNYMVFLIDEDVKCRGPLRKALKEGDASRIEACVQPATAINSELINMMHKLFEFLLELKPFADETNSDLIYESAELARAVTRVSADKIFSYNRLITDDTYLYVVKRENEIALEETDDLYSQIFA